MGHAVEEGTTYLDANNGYNIQVIFNRNKSSGKKVILILMPGTETAVKYGQLHVADIGYSSAAGV